MGKADKKDNMTYDDALKRLEAIVKELEASEALSMDAYQKKAVEAKRLLAFCQQQLSAWEEKMDSIL